MEWAAAPERRGPPPTECFESDGEVEVANLFDHVGVAACRAAREPAEEGQHEVLGRVVTEQRFAALEVALLRFRGPLAILDRHAPLAAPRSRNVDAINRVDPFGRLRVHLVLPEDE